MVEGKVLRYLLQHVVSIAIVSAVCIVFGVFIVPHLPISNKKSFAILLRTQMTLDHEQSARADKQGRSHLLLLGSSVVERDISDEYLDSLFTQKHIPYFAINAGAGGSFANENLISFRAMLAHGLRPERVIYGTFVQEFNGKFLLHNSLGAKDTSFIGFREKSIWNALRYGAASLSSMLDAPNFHIYVFTLNNAFRDVQDPTILQRLSFGENMYARDSGYEFNPTYLNDLKTIYSICKERHIPFALFNSPVRPKIESLAEFPYLHKTEAYLELEKFAEEENLPLWNFDAPEKFSENDFLDTYHLNARGTHKLTEFLATKVIKWNKGFIEQDILSSPYSIGGEVKDSLVPTVFHF
jgi:hypothetical protein